MSRRTLNKQEGSSNPTTKFLEWKSKDKTFGYYDKDKQDQVLLPLPFKFQFLEEFHTIKGFHGDSESSIYSNEIKTFKEELVVKAFKSQNPIAKGLYNDIKNDIKVAGGKYGKSIYALLNGEIVNFQLYGASITPFIFFTSGDKKNNIKGHSHLLESNFVEVKDYADKKKGANKYTEPIFSIGEKFTTDEYNLADEKYKVIADYFNGYSKKEEVTPELEESEDLDF